MKSSMNLSSEEKKIEKDLLEGRYQEVSVTIFKEIEESLSRRKKDAVLNIRINSEDLLKIKRKAKKMGVRYQTFISEILHKVAI